MEIDSDFKLSNKTMAFGNLLNKKKNLNKNNYFYINGDCFHERDKLNSVIMLFIW